MDKKKLILIILAVIAFISLFRGIVKFSKGGKKINARHIPQKIQLQEGVIEAKPDPKKSKYKAWGKNPFTLQRKKVMNVSSASQGLALNGILWNEKEPKAIINNEIFYVNDKIDDNIIIKIDENKVVLSNVDNGKLLELMLWQE